MRYIPLWNRLTLRLQMIPVDQHWRKSSTEVSISHGKVHEIDTWMYHTQPVIYSLTPSWKIYSTFIVRIIHVGLPRGNNRRGVCLHVQLLPVQQSCRLTGKQWWFHGHVPYLCHATLFGISPMITSMKSTHEFLFSLSGSFTPCRHLRPSSGREHTIV